MVARVAGASQVRLIRTSRRTKKTRQKERRAKEAGERAASEAERAEPPRAQLRANIEYVMEGLRSAAAQTRSQAGSKIGVEYSLPPETDDGYRRGPSKVYATAPQGTVTTTVASDWLADELAEHGELEAALPRPHSDAPDDGRRRLAPADGVFRFKAGETMQTSRPTSASGEDDDEDADRSEDYSDDGRASDL